MAKKFAPKGKLSSRDVRLLASILKQHGIYPVTKFHGEQKLWARAAYRAAELHRYRDFPAGQVIHHLEKDVAEAIVRIRKVFFRLVKVHARDFRHQKETFTAVVERLLYQENVPLSVLIPQVEGGMATDEILETIFAAWEVQKNHPDSYCLIQRALKWKLKRFALELSFALDPPESLVLRRYASAKGNVPSSLLQRILPDMTEKFLGGCNLEESVLSHPSIVRAENGRYTFRVGLNDLPPQSLSCPLCHDYTNPSLYLWDHFVRKTDTPDLFAYWAAVLVTHYRHEHVRYYDLSWKNWAYRDKNPEYRDHDSFKQLVNNRAKRQLLRGVRKTNWPVELKKRLIRGFLRLQHNDEKTIALAQKCLAEFSKTSYT